MSPTVTLPILHHAPIVVGSTEVTVTWSAASQVITEAPVFRQTLVAVASSDISFAGTVPTDLVAGSSHHNNATRITIAWLAAQWVILAESKVALLAVVTACAFDVGFATALPSNHPHVQVSVTITHSPIQ